VLGACLLLRWYGVEQVSDSLIRLADIGTVLVVIGIWLLAAWQAVQQRAEFGLHPVFLKTELIQVGGLVVVLLALDRTVLALYAGIGLTAILLWLALSRPSERFVAALIAGATLLGGALELVFLVDDLAGTDWYRMNTIFKFYNQVWVLLGIATAALIGRAIWQVVAGPGSAPEERDETAHTGDERERPSRSAAWSIAALGITGAVVIASLAYPVVATPIRLNQHFPQDGREWTLDAFQWMEYGEIRFTNGEWVGYADDLAAIDWVNEHVDGTPVIAEASFGTYRCNGSRFSIATGLPAVIGWQRHEQQQRYLDDLAKREQDLRDLYASTDVSTKQSIIERYGIEYIVVGQTERKYPTIDGNECIDTEPDAGIEALEGMVGTSLEVAFTQGTTTVYRVISG
jgi:uncharacterized membrane protein